MALTTSSNAALPRGVDPFGGAVAFQKRRALGSRAQRVRKPLAFICLAMALLAAIILASTWYNAAPNGQHAWFQKSNSSIVTRADIVFVIDATGSMSDEIEDVKANLMGIGNRLANRKPPPDIRFGAVFYRDVEDEELVRAVPLSHDLKAVREAIMDVRATGGGDWPEHVGIGLHKALEMNWTHSADSGVRLIYLVADAPYKSYDDGYGVPAAVELAEQMGVKVHVIGCSGLGRGRQDMESIAKATGGNFSHFERQSGSQHSPRSPRPRSADFAETKVSGFEVERRIDSPVVGIDLGNTKACVGIYKNGRAEIIPNDVGERTTPSYVALVNDSYVVGEEAKALAAFDPSGVVFGMKRLMRQRLGDDLKTLPFDVVEKGGKLFVGMSTAMRNATAIAPEALLAAVASKMKATAEDYLGTEIKHAVITVPARFNDSQRQAVKSAGTTAGLDVLRIINEPTAAAIAYGLDKRTEENILVYDLGGDSLDVSVLTIDYGVFDYVATSGDAHLGGVDFDERVVQHFRTIAERKYNFKFENKTRALEMLRREVERAKRVLSSTYSAPVDLKIPGSDDSVDAEAPRFLSEVLTRARFEELNKDLFARTLIPVRQVLEDSALTAGEIDQVVLVGGSTRIPAIQRLVEDMFPGKVNRGINPDEAVAYGAAVQAGLLSGEGGTDLLLLDVTPLTLGLETAGGMMTPVIRRNTVIPSRKSLTLSTHRDNQTAISFRVCEGERPLAKTNHELAEFRVGGISPAPAGIAQIKVTFDIDYTGTLTVSAEDKGHGKREEVTITHDENRLTEEQIERMIRDAELFAEEDAVAMNAAKIFADTDGERLRNGTGKTCADWEVDGCSSLGVVLSAAEGLADEDVAVAERSSTEEMESEEKLGRLSELMMMSISDEL